MVGFKAALHHPASREDVPLDYERDRSSRAPQINRHEELPIPEKGETTVIFGKAESSSSRNHRYYIQKIE